MNVALRQTMTLEQFLRWEERQELRYEFDGIRPIAMTGGTESHSLIQAALITALTSKLRGTPCRAHGSHLRLRLARSVRYPDVFVTCSKPAPQSTTATEPVVIFEILSPSTTNEDLVVKNAEYRATPSVQRYVVLEQTHAAAIVFSRKGDLWAADTLAGPDAVLDLPEIGATLTLGEVYGDIALTGEPADEDLGQA